MDEEDTAQQINLKINSLVKHHGKTSVKIGRNSR